MKNNIIIKSLIAAALAMPIFTTTAGAANSITPGARWNDTSGQHINAHGGCVVYSDGAYYWFGEDRTKSESNGISCYTSTDLYNWKRVGLAFKAANANDPETGKCILERPKVIYNEKTGKWVMYIHWENGLGYGEARICVATSDKLTGEYKFESTFRPNNHDSRDQTAFVDTDGKAYHFCATDMNTNINVALLSDDYLTPASPVVETKILLGKRLEAPAIVKLGDTYFGVFSGCSGWDPNPGHSATSTEILGNWTEGRNFAVDNDAATTYHSQSTYIFKVADKEGAYVYMGDRWKSSDVGGASEYVWLPISFRSGAPVCKWHDSWDMSAFDNSDRFARIVKPFDGAKVRLLDKYSDRWVSTTGNGFYIADDDDKQNIELTLHRTDNPYVWKLEESATGRYFESQFGALIFNERSESPMQLWRLELKEDGSYLIQNVNDGKVLTVSGSAQLAKTPVFMSKPGATVSQEFGLYFDKKANDYEAADMYAAGYRAANRQIMHEQSEYETEMGVTSAVLSGEVEIGIDADAVVLRMSQPGVLPVRIVDATSGITVYDKRTTLQAGVTRILLPVKEVYVVAAGAKTRVVRL